MKIALVTSLHDPKNGAGTAMVTQALAKELKRAGHSVLVITSSPCRLLSVRKPQEGIASFYPLNLYWVGHKNRYPRWLRTIWQIIDIWNPHSYLKIRSFLRQECPDLVHVHKLRGLSPAVWAAAAAAGVLGVVHTCHDYELISPEGNLRGKVGELAKASRFPISLYQSFRATQSRTVDVAISPAQFTLNSHIQRGFFSRAKHLIVRNTHGLTGEQIASLTRKKAQSRPDKNASNFLYMGRLEEEKGIRILLEAFTKAIKVQSGVHLSVAGVGSLFSTLRDQYAGSCNIDFRGFVSGDEKRQLLLETDVMIVPTTYPEISPVSIAEAYAFGVPVIASAVGGIPEIVHCNESGILVKPNCVISLARAILKLATDDEMFQFLKSGSQRLAGQLTLERFMDAHHSAYNLALK